ncbi:AMP-dependent synthetase and ligase [Neobacillus bataviensis LMG 21833]|uniref:AMP-dependent synthetase and ligase n=1 Tax=Neobacillus bataviensis LMG 21833 TaxID=1117379 RepID=K6D8X0_9BACI|nr:long-chain fatty acid--CoA ligase [Neobacillus bataviensis]EKN64508.1 AMP-dependent synthetase and ligase [Neobacillus bataviensis LMG 21833]
MRWELDWLENRARLSPNKIAVIDELTNKAWTFEQLNKRAYSTVSWLYTRGVKKGDRVALLSPNHISYFDLLFACGKIGAIFVPLNWRLSMHEINEILADCTPKVIGIHPEFEAISQQLNTVSTFLIGDANYEVQVSYSISEEISETDPLAMIYTGGTTGKPKGVVLSHQSILWNAINTILSWGLAEDDVTVNYMPMFHTGGLNALSIPLLMMGGTVVIGEPFLGEKAVETLHRFNCTTILLVPTMYHSLVQTDEFQKSDFPCMKIFLSGAAPCPMQIYEAFQKKGLAFKEGYGLTEAGPNNFYISPEDAQMNRGSVGKPMLFNTIKLVKTDGSETEPNEVGELLIKGKHSFSFYWNHEQETKETVKDGWIHTGDLAKRDEQGFYYIVGRKKEMIITGGENVYPLEIEQWLAAHPAIDEVAVLGLPDEKWGEVVAAFITFKHTYSIQDEELITYCESKLGRYKIPKLFIRLEELPKTHVGKIDKKKLKEMNIHS